AGDVVRVTPDGSCGSGAAVTTRTDPIVLGGSLTSVVFGRAGAPAGSTEAVRAVAVPAFQPGDSGQVAPFNAVPRTASIGLEVSVQSDGGSSAYVAVGGSVAYGTLSALATVPSDNAPARTVRVTGQPQMTVTLERGKSALLLATGAWGDPAAS